MKLLCCVKCNQVFNLSFDYTECKGEHCGGQYINTVDAKIWGELDKVFLLGFANNSFTSALKDQINLGDQTQKFVYCGQSTTKGREFTAFVIPADAPTVIRVIKKCDYNV
jgi:hypothetical protein